MRYKKCMLVKVISWYQLQCFLRSFCLSKQCVRLVLDVVMCDVVILYMLLCLFGPRVIESGPVGCL